MFVFTKQKYLQCQYDKNIATTLEARNKMYTEIYINKYQFSKKLVKLGENASSSCHF